MRAAVTEQVGAISLRHRPEPPPPGPGRVIVAPRAVGICGSDYHFFAGELSEAAGGSQFPRVQGHEIAATIVALGPRCRPELALDQRVALWPLHACGHCYPCSVGRPSACDNFQLIGIHIDGGLQELLCTGQEQVFPIRADDAAVASLAEPMSVAVRAVRRAAIRPGEKLVVMGAGPIGHCVAVAAGEVGAEVLMVDPQASRLRLGRQLEVQTLEWTSAEAVVAFARDWAAPGGPPVVVDASGVPAAVRAMVDMVASAGRAVQVGMSGAEVSLRIGSLTEKELDVLGVSCCDRDDFSQAIGLVERHAALLAQLITQEFALEQAPDALRFAIGNPTEVMKVVIRNG